VDKTKEILSSYIVTKILEALSGKLPFLKVIIFYQFAKALIKYIAEAMIETQLIVIDIRKKEDLDLFQTTVNQYNEAKKNGDPLLKEKENEVIDSFKRFVRFG
jgi:predicted phosphoadenosine phosphosulfate sulfurtransferase